MRQCTGRCKEIKDESCFYKSNSNKSGFRGPCIVCTREKGEIWNKENPENKSAAARARKEKDPVRYLVEGARDRASNFNIPFNITKEDIEYNGYCACCNTILSHGRGGFNAASPTLDKVINNLGYIKGNMQVICWRCNSKKSNLDLKELEMLVYYIKFYSQ